MTAFSTLPGIRTVGTVVVGAGQAGLAVSHELTARRHDHVVLERGRIGERWRRDSWDSLHLLTPNWANALPGWPYRGDDPDGFMAAPAFTDSLARYARSFGAPVIEDVTVEVVQPAAGGLVVATDAGCWRAQNVVVATGWCERPAVPAITAGVDRRIEQVTPTGYRNPDELPAGGVLVVGASATGVQLADELRASGRRVVLAVGGHTRLPRRYRGMDIFWWLARIGALSRTVDDVADPRRVRREPSLQLAGRPDHRGVDLATLGRAGVELAGRLVGVDGTTAHFAGDLVRTVGAADERLRRLLARIDRHVDATGLDGEVLDEAPPRPVDAGDGPSHLDLRAAGITTVVWATGHRRHYGWLPPAALDGHGELRQRRGVTPVPGLYVVGQRFQHRRDSSFIGGVGRDAAAVAEHLTGRGPAAPQTTRSPVAAAG